MLKRKVESLLLKWKNEPDHNPLIVKGCRQCGKTFSVCDFAKKHYEHVVYLNFFKNETLRNLFKGSLEIDDLIARISVVLSGDIVFEPGKTIIIFDEIQDCPEARTSLKFFKEDGRFDVISTGSLLGVCGYGNEPASIPVGYESFLNMYPLDFEEFLWALGMTQENILYLKGFFEREEEVPSAIHEKMRELMRQYVIVGGMPKAVDCFATTRQFNLVLNIQNAIIASYEDDMIKYAAVSDKPIIRECFRSIPRQLSKENKKFQYKTIKKGSTASRYQGSLQWIEDAGIISRCYNLSLPELPLDGNSLPDVFKVYMQDTGLFVSMLEPGTQIDILQGNLFGYKGAIFENLIADIFTKMGRKLYYYHKDSGLEIDFVMRYRGEAVLVEVKAQTGNAKSLKTILAYPEKYHINNAVKLGDYNIGRLNNVLTLPLYMAFFLTDY